MKVRIATAQYAIRAPHDFSAFADRLSEQVATAVAQGAQIVVLPEYISLEIAAALTPAVREDFVASLAGLQVFHVDFLALMRELAQRHAIYLVAGSFLLEVGAGLYRNRAYFISLSGEVAFQDKLCLTGFEREAKVIQPGDVLKVFDTGFGRLAIDICYDIEFPLYARVQCEAGARLILVPSCTDTEAGANRVRIGCQARAMENQVYVACAVTAGAAQWSPALDTNSGVAAIYTPIDRGFPSDGVLVRADGDWAIAEVDLAMLDAYKRDAQVGISADWPAQSRPTVLRARVEKLPG